MKIEIDIQSVVIVSGHGPDHVLLQTTLKEATWPYTGTQTIRVIVAQGSALKWLHDNCDITPEKIPVQLIET